MFSSQEGLPYGMSEWASYDWQMQSKVCQLKNQNA